MRTKTDITLSVDKDVIAKMREKEINLSQFFEKTAMKMFEDKDVYVEISARGNKVYQKLIYLKSEDKDGHKK